MVIMNPHSLHIIHRKTQATVCAIWTQTLLKWPRHIILRTKFFKWFISNSTLGQPWILSFDVIILAILGHEDWNNVLYGNQTSFFSQLDLSLLQMVSPSWICLKKYPENTQQAVNDHNMTIVSINAIIHPLFVYATDYEMKRYQN